MHEISREEGLDIATLVEVGVLNRAVMHGGDVDSDVLLVGDRLAWRGKASGRRTGSRRVRRLTSDRPGRYGQDPQVRSLAKECLKEGCAMALSSSCASFLI